MANERLEGGLVNFFSFVDVDRAACVSVETRVEETGRARSELTVAVVAPEESGSRNRVLEILATPSSTRHGGSFRSASARTPDAVAKSTRLWMM